MDEGKKASEHVKIRRIRYRMCGSHSAMFTESCAVTALNYLVQTNTFTVFVNRETVTIT